MCHVMLDGQVGRVGLRQCREGLEQLSKLVFVVDDCEVRAGTRCWVGGRGDGGEWIYEPPAFDVHQQVVMTEEVSANDCLRDGPNVECPLKGTSQSEIDLHGAPREDRYLRIVGSVEMQDRREVPMSRNGGEDTDIRASVYEEPQACVVITNMEQR